MNLFGDAVEEVSTDAVAVRMDGHLEKRRVVDSTRGALRWVTILYSAEVYIRVYIIYILVYIYIYIHYSRRGATKIILLHNQVGAHIQAPTHSIMHTVVVTVGNRAEQGY